MTEIKAVGVIGAGQMGAGIAHVCALNGYDVLLNDVSREQIDKGLDAVKKGLERQVSKGQIDQAEMDAVIAVMLRPRWQNVLLIERMNDEQHERLPG